MKIDWHAILSPKGSYFIIPQPRHDFLAKPCMTFMMHCKIIIHELRSAVTKT